MLSSTFDCRFPVQERYQLDGTLISRNNLDSKNSQPFGLKGEGKCLDRTLHEKVRQQGHTPRENEYEETFTREICERYQSNKLLIHSAEQGRGTSMMSPNVDPSRLFSSGMLPAAVAFFCSFCLPSKGRNNENSDSPS